MRLADVGHHFSDEFIDEIALDILFNSNKLNDKYDYYDDCWLLVCEVPTSEINFDKTLWKRANFLYENEINVNGSVKLLECEKYYGKT